MVAAKPSYPRRVGLARTRLVLRLTVTTERCSVQTEQVVRIVLALHITQPIDVGAEGGVDPVGFVLGGVVHVRARRRVGRERGRVSRTH